MTIQYPSLKTTPLVTVLMPTRSRFDLVKQSIESLLSAAKDPDRIEILLRIDDDDDAMISKLPHLPYPHNIGYIIGPRMKGYLSLNIFYNELCEISSGQFLFLWNDDLFMKTKHWDTVVETYREQVCCLKFNINYNDNENSAPCLHRTIYNILGHFSPNVLSDSFLYYVLAPLNLVIYEPKVEIFHDRFEDTGNNNDLVYLEGREDIKTIKEEWKSDPLVLLLIEIDMIKVLDYLKNNRLKVGSGDQNIKTFSLRFPEEKYIFIQTSEYNTRNQHIEVCSRIDSDYADPSIGPNEAPTWSRTVWRTQNKKIQVLYFKKLKDHDRVGILERV